MKTQESIHSYHALPPASAERTLPYYLYEFVKTYLYAVFSKMALQPELQVMVMTAKAGPTDLKQQLISVTDEEGSNYFKVSSAFVDTTVRYNNRLYAVSLYRDRETIFTRNHMYVLGLESEAKQPEQLLQFISRQAIRISAYQNAWVQLCSVSTEFSDRDFYVRKMELDPDLLSNVYLPQGALDSTGLLINAINEYSTAHTPLRYLFSGKPGTGKTKLIRAIANECKGKATFIFCEGTDFNIDVVFDFVEYFSPVVLCIDDIDLMTGSRDDGTNKQQLGKLLQKLDGFSKNNFFLLATTNDKQLVDLAASRPGRFDAIIDVSLIQPEQYLSLVQSKTSDQAIIGLFDGEVLSLLQRKQVSGAFIANLIKHLTLLARFEPSKVTHDYVVEQIDASFRGFYKKPEPTNGRMGFQQSSLSGVE